MGILKNKHLVAAMIVAPLLAILAYFATDYLVSEKPKAAKAGSNYKLAANSDCRYQSGSCTLKNGDIKIVLLAKRLSENLIRLSMFSETPVERALVVFSNDPDTPPNLFKKIPTEDHAWVAELNLNDPEDEPLRLAVVINGSSYYVETSSIFVDYETTFSRENFSENQ